MTFVHGASIHSTRVTLRFFISRFTAQFSQIRRANATVVIVRLSSERTHGIMISSQWSGYFFILSTIDDSLEDKLRSLLLVDLRSTFLSFFAGSTWSLEGGRESLFLMGLVIPWICACCSLICWIAGELRDSSSNEIDSNPWTNGIGVPLLLSACWSLSESFEKENTITILSTSKSLFCTYSGNIDTWFSTVLDRWREIAVRHLWRTDSRSPSIAGCKKRRTSLTIPEFLVDLLRIFSQWNLSDLRCPCVECSLQLIFSGIDPSGHHDCRERIELIIDSKMKSRMESLSSSSRDFNALNGFHRVSTEIVVQFANCSWIYPGGFGWSVWQFPSTVVSCCSVRSSTF